MEFVTLSRVRNYDQQRAQRLLVILGADTLKETYADDKEVMNFINNLTGKF